jgi:hypothetical protein
MSFHEFVVSREVEKIKTRYTRITTVVALGFALCLFAEVAFAQTKSQYEFTHYEGYQQGLEAAKSTNKPILLDFYFDT